MTIRISHILDLSVGTFADEYDLTKIDVSPASEAAARRVLSASEVGMDGRSNWLWFRLPNGDLIFGCYPEGQTYFDTETDHASTIAG